MSDETNRQRLFICNKKRPECYYLCDGSCNATSNPEHALPEIYISSVEEALFYIIDQFGDFEDVKMP